MHVARARNLAGVLNKRLALGWRAMSSKEVVIPLTNPYKLHKLENGPAQQATTSAEQMMQYFREMYKMRRVEITNDNEYKARNIRGFCHLYDGQEAVAMGVEAAIEKSDSWITSYRCHAVAMCRGSSPEMVFAELFGFVQGTAKGKGGSMHFYSKKNNFYGGAGIVGAQVPVGVGLAFANKYNAKPGERMNVSVSMYGDGAANQGQLWEAANMAALWKLPAIYVIENNQYGMGTSVQRSSSNNDYYTQGNHIPGIRVDGMNVLSVREAMKFAKEYCATGNGPILVEMNTYRYHGHSMSDPGTSYRNRDEVSNVRSARDPIEAVKKIMLDHGLSTAEELKAVEKTIRDEVQEALLRAKAGNQPPLEELYTHVYTDDAGKTEYPPFVRMPDREKSKRAVNGKLVGL